MVMRWGWGHGALLRTLVLASVSSMAAILAAVLPST